MNDEILMGHVGTDAITGFKGTVTAICKYITGCDRYLLTPSCKLNEEHTAVTSNWFDANRVSVSKTDVCKVIPTGTGVNDNGADIAAPIK